MCMSPSLEQNNDYHSLNIYYMLHLGALTYVLSFGLTLTKRQISTQISIFLSLRPARVLYKQDSIYSGWLPYNLCFLTCETERIITFL